MFTPLPTTKLNIATLTATRDMNPSYCTQCNGLKFDSIAGYSKSTSATLLQAAVKEGCQSCQIILEGIQTFILPSEDFEAELNWSNDGQLSRQRSLKVLVWAGLRMTRNPRRSKVADAVAPLRLEFFTQPNQPSPWPVFGPSPEISTNSASESCFQRIEEWIRNCMKGHADCQQPSKTALPSRLIDVGSTDSETLKLVETRGAEGTYFTLSHCWGGNQPLKTTKATLHERMDGIEWASIPKTFQDAVTITRRLQMRYIWIDSLCIVQDDGDDWEKEAANMGAIYEASLLTISASIASNPNHGIFSRRLPPHQICGVDSNGDKYSVFIRKMIPHTYLSTEAAKGPKSDIPLLTRAWAYQERLLATRVLHYLPDELFWECRSAIRCECGVYVPGAKLRHHSKRGFSKVIQRNQAEPAKLAIEPWRWTVTEIKMWPQIVAEYSARDLTFRKDRLPALSGVARQLHTSNPSLQYLAGLWRDHLPEALLWRVMRKRPEKKRDSRREGPLGSRDLQPGAQTPSWSWASLEGGLMSISYPEKKLVDEKVTIIDAQTIPSGIDPFGSVKQGTIKLRGPVVAAVLSYSEYRDDHSITVQYILTCAGISRPFIPDTPLSNEDNFDFLRSGATVYCLLVGSFVAGGMQSLVLRQSKMFADMHRRLGMLTFFDKVTTDTLAGSWFEKTQNIELILI
jgi:hypothetical protein